MITVKRVQLPLIFLLVVTSLLTLTIPHQLINHYLFVRSAVALVDKVDIEWMGYTSEKKITLTFDDGPDPRYTPAILKILAHYQVPAVFYLTGENVRLHPDLVRAELAAGHEIGNHTVNHPHLRTLSVAQIRQQIERTDVEIAKITGRKPELFRPPYEELTEGILSAARLCNKRIIMSTITIEHHTLPLARQKALRAINMAFPGAIILAHDGRADRSATVAALPYLIEGLQKKGYRFVPLSELLRQNH